MANEEIGGPIMEAGTGSYLGVPTRGWGLIIALIVGLLGWGVIFYLISHFGLVSCTIGAVVIGAGCWGLIKFRNRK